MEARWTAIDVVRDILGDAFVSLDEGCTPGRTLVKEGDFFEFNNGHESLAAWDGDVYTRTFNCVAPSIMVDRLDATSVRSIAGAAHEAYHAFLLRRFGGDIYRDEAHVNELAAAWIRQNLGGFKQHAAREMILASNLSYGLH